MKYVSGSDGRGEGGCTKILIIAEYQNSNTFFKLEIKPKL